ncbi:MAG: hypothetical protein U0V64_14180 [Cyclobacteriaceae bacterium]
MKRLTVIVLLVTMVLHCSSRLGVLSYLYQQRHVIAITLGLSTETPIASCGSYYHAGQELIVPDSGHSEAAPAVLSLAQSIDLFHIPSFQLRPNLGDGIAIARPITAGEELPSRPTDSLLRPPLSC